MELYDTSVKVVEYLGSKQNILTTTVCMTRLRFTLRDTTLVQTDDLCALQSVLGVVCRGNHGIEVVFGPGVISKVYQYVVHLLDDASKLVEPTIPERPQGNIRVQINPASEMSMDHSFGTGLEKQLQVSGSDLVCSTMSEGHGISQDVSHPFESDDCDDCDCDECDDCVDCDDYTTLYSLFNQESEDMVDSLASEIDIHEEIDSLKLLVINGPNINFLGVREPEIYGNNTYRDIVELCEKTAVINGFSECRCMQSNHEGDLVDEIQHAYRVYDGIIINPAAFTHTSIAIRDALATVQIPAVEVHISDISKREDFRAHSYISDICLKTIVGEGIDGYRQAIEYIADVLKNKD